LSSLNGSSPDHPIIIEILIQVFHLHKLEKSVVLFWVSGHAGLSGNEADDAAAKVVALHRTLVPDSALSSKVCTFLHYAVFCHYKANGLIPRVTKCAL
jgi:hypothetical protein